MYSSRSANAKKLGEDASAMRLFVSTATYDAALQVAKLHSSILSALINTECTDADQPPADCVPAPRPTIQEVSRAEDSVRKLAEADLNRAEGPR